ncbi:hypothetical protein CBP51_06730 [Cellvibrio mixtus]|jgi:uncharacterized membrane protein YsdA (DUF1294 family)|uniref:Cold-shock protein n=2 Tax=Cellvibrio mixtus TaxID=39650 RepID=A0A266Q9Z8_9GAMM|nr:hypothetical protein CBP51_06730 [Cellvibrio mixtus]
MAAQSARYKKPQHAISWGLLVIMLLLPVVGVINLFLRFHTVLPLAAMVFTSLLAYYFYWQDKRRAQRNEWRIPEANLHFWSLVGGWPGAFVAQQQFRHKTKKISFLSVFWLIVLSHQVLWFDWLLMDGKWLLSVLA